jgi:acetylornithine deacetylase/succinyl-diaminopimelate desuccinylase-like protein
MSVGAIDWRAVGDETVELLRRYPMMVGFTDTWVFRTLGLHGYGWSPFVLDDGEFRRIHGNPGRVSLDNVRAGARSYTEMLLAVAAA